MFKNYLTVAWRSLLKNRWHSLINIVGLTVGMSIFMVLSSIIRHELSFDKFRPDYDRIYRIYSEFSGVFEGTNRGIPGPTGEKLKSDFSGIESSTQFLTLASDVLVKNEGKEPEIFADQSDVIFADEDYFKTVQGYTWLSNNQQANFSEPYQVILTDAKARKYFKVADPLNAIGRQLIYHDSLMVTVSGIVKMPDENSDFYFSDFISLASARHSSLQDKIDLEHWANTNSSAQLFIKIKPGVSADQIESQFAPLIDLYNAENEDPSWIYNFRLQPLSDLHYNSKIGIFDSSPWPTANKSTLRILLLVSLLLLAIAIVNFINLETARATQRAKDIGIRKTLGSSRLALITQYFGEALLLTFSAIAISIGLADLGCRYFSEFLPTGFELDLFSVFGITTIILLWLSVSLLSGIYPALIITKYDATSAVSGVNLATGKSRLRHGLIIFQFVIAQFFIAATIFVSRQINHVLEKDLGFSTDAIINIGFPRQADKSTRMVFAENLANIPGIVQISTHDETPARRGWSSSTMTYLKDDSSKIELNVYRKFGDEKFIPLYDINLVAGQNFRTSDSLTELVINQTYAKQLGFSNEADAIGVTIELNDQKIPIVGVVKDFNFKSLRDHIEPVALGISRQCNMVSIKLASSDLSINGLDHIVESVEANWKQHFPNEEFQYAFYDEAIAKFYDGEKRIAKLLKAVTTIVILISCLGLLGLVTFMTERRRKEIGIRKVLGATSLRILYLLSGDFLLLILISLVIATPICWYFINQWLKNFAYHTNISWWVFFVTGLCSIMIALVTISSQGLKAALANPVDSLRNE